MRSPRSACLLALFAGVGLSACVGYTPSPTPGRGEFVGETVTFPAAEDILVAALSEVVWRYPVDGEFAISFPPALPRERIERVLQRLDEPRAHMLTADRLGLPTYRIESIQVVGDAATVQLHRPVGLPRPATGESLTQAFTLQLRGGVRPWRVVSTRAWPVGSIAAPLLSVVPEPPPPVPRSPAAPKSASDYADPSRR
ncbi:MAG: hypothetical protein IBJ10_06755 [Phycisphaerales bacterium]|nr:hypothetical protein [Phycisphaerales bacterium]